MSGASVSKIDVTSDEASMGSMFASEPRKRRVRYKDRAIEDPMPHDAAQDRFSFFGSALGQKPLQRRSNVTSIPAARELT